MAHQQGEWLHVQCCYTLQRKLPDAHPYAEPPYGARASISALGCVYMICCCTLSDRVDQHPMPPFSPSGPLLVSLHHP